MSAMASQITGVSIVCSTVSSGAYQRKHQSSASLVFVREIHRWQVNFPHKGPVTRKEVPFDDVIMEFLRAGWYHGVGTLSVLITAPCGFPSKGTEIMRSFDIFFAVIMNSLLWKQSTSQWLHPARHSHYNDVIMSTIASQITNLTIVYSTVYLATDQRKHQSSASLAFVRGIYRRPVNSPHKWPVTRKMFPFDDVIMMWRHCIDISIFSSPPVPVYQQWACEDSEVTLFCENPNQVRGCNPGGHYWDYCPGVLPLFQVTATHFEIGCP